METFVALVKAQSVAAGDIMQVKNEFGSVSSVVEAISYVDDFAIVKVSGATLIFFAYENQPFLYYPDNEENDMSPLRILVQDINEETIESARALQMSLPGDKKKESGFWRWAGGQVADWAQGLVNGVFTAGRRGISVFGKSPAGMVIAHTWGYIGMQGAMNSAGPGLPAGAGGA